MNTAKRIAKNTFFLFLSNLLQKILSLFIMIFIAQQLGVGDFGVYSFIFSFALLFSVFGDLGITTYIMREMAKDKLNAPVLLGDAIVIKGTLFLIIFLAGLAIGSAMHFFYPESYPVIIVFLIMLAILSVLLDSIANIFRTAFFSFEKMELDFYSNLLIKTILFIVSFSVLALGYGLWALVLATAGTSLLNVIISYFLCSKKICAPKIIFAGFSKYKALLFTILPFSLIWFFSSFYGNIDMVLLSFFKGNTEVAFYSAAVRLVNALSFIPTALMSSIFPVFAVLFSQKNESIRMALEKSIKYLLIIILPVAVGTTILAQRIIAAIYPTTATNNFGPAAIALQILMWFSVLNFVNLVFLNALSSTAFEKRTTLLLGVTMLINFFSNILLIPAFGFAGAAISMVISEAFFFLFGYLAISKRLCKINLQEFFLKPSVAAIVMAIFLWFFNAIHLYALILLGGIVYFIIIFILRAFDEQDIAIFLKVLKIKK